MNIVKILKKIFLKTKLIYLLVVLALLWPFRHAIYCHWMDYIYTKKINQNFMKNLNKALDSGQKTVKIFDLAGISNYKIIDVCFDYREFNYETKQKIEKDTWTTFYVLDHFPSKRESLGIIYIELSKEIINLIPIDRGKFSRYCYRNFKVELQIKKEFNKINIMLFKEEKK